jgi:hypothetical protein
MKKSTTKPCSDFTPLQSSPSDLGTLRQSCRSCTHYSRVIHRCEFSDELAYDEDEI